MRAKMMQAKMMQAKMMREQMVRERMMRERMVRERMMRCEDGAVRNIGEAKMPTSPRRAGKALGCPGWWRQKALKYPRNSPILNESWLLIPAI